MAWPVHKPGWSRSIFAIQFIIPKRRRQAQNAQHRRRQARRPCLADINIAPALANFKWCCPLYWYSINIWVNESSIISGSQATSHHPMREKKPGEHCLMHVTEAGVKPALDWAHFEVRAWGAESKYQKEIAAESGCSADINPAIVYQ